VSAVPVVRLLFTGRSVRPSRQCCGARASRILATTLAGEPPARIKVTRRIRPTQTWRRVDAECGGRCARLEEGAWGRNLWKVSPQLAQPQKTCRSKSGPDQTNECAEPGVTPSRCETGQNWPIGSSAPKLTQGATPARLENTKTYPAKHPADRPWDTSGIPLPSPASFRVKLALLDAERRMTGLRQKSH
jgi:hypothetical protein